MIIRDLFVKHVVGAKNYLRYSDDFCIFHNDKRFLTAAKGAVTRFIADELDLTLSRVNIRPANGMNFVGFRLFCSFVVLRRKTAKKIRDRMRNFLKNTEMLSFVSRRSSLAAVTGLLKWAKTYNLRKVLFISAR